MEDFSFPAQPRFSHTIFTLGARRNASRCLLGRVPAQARICVIRSGRRSGRGAEYQRETALAGLPGRALLAPAGFRGAGRARPGRRRRRLPPLPGHGGEWGGEPAALRGRPKSKTSFLPGFRVNEAQGPGPGSAGGFGSVAASAAASRPVISLVPSRLGRKAAAVPARPRESRQRSVRHGPAAVPRRAGPV